MTQFTPRSLEEINYSLAFTNTWDYKHFISIVKYWTSISLLLLLLLLFLTFFLSLEKKSIFYPSLNINKLLSFYFSLSKQSCSIILSVISLYILHFSYFIIISSSFFLSLSFHLISIHFIWFHFILFHHIIIFLFLLSFFLSLSLSLSLPPTRNSITGIHVTNL